MTTNELQVLREKFIESAGQFSQSLGFGRNLGQIYAYLYFNAEPQTLDDLTSQLGVSKGSASMSVRQLEDWNALRRVWVKGDRKDYYQATEEFGRIIRKALLDLVGQKMEAADNLLDQAELQLKTHGNGSREAALLRQRVARLRTFRQKAQGLWESSIIRLLLK
jgi:DNA-binding transcriptional regulator GbsR (MarR family)